MTMTFEKDYFAMAEASELTGYFAEKDQEWSTYLDKSGLKRRWRRSYELYYGKHFKKNNSSYESEIQRGGDRGELASFYVNHYRNLIKHTLVMTTNQKPAFDTKAINSDLKSITQARIGNHILDAYLNQNRLIRYPKRAAEMSQVFGKAFVSSMWDPTMGSAYSSDYETDLEGQPVMDETGSPKTKVIYEGDVSVECLSPYDVYVDPALEDWTKLEWARMRFWKNKFNLAVQYPALADKIKNLQTKAECDSYAGSDASSFKGSAIVPMYIFLHKASQVLPNGRMVIYCADDVILYDGPSPYENIIPLFRIVPGEIFGTTEGYTDAFDLMGCQEAIDVLVSIAFTNQQANGVQKIWIPDGGNVTSQQISKGLAVIRGPAGAEPKPLQLTATAAEIFNFIPMIQKMMETTSGINSVARGDPEQSLKSGIAIAYVQAMAAQYTSAFQQSWAELLEDFATDILWKLKKFASTPRKLAIAGKRNKFYFKDYTKDDLEGVDRVVIELGNPITKTVAGRLDIADKLLEKGMVKTPQEYLTVMESGQLEPIVKGTEAELDLIHKENETLMDGGMHKALVGDSHLLHMQEHKSILSDPEIRQRAAAGEPEATGIVTNTLQAIMDHKQLYETQEPIWSMISGEPPAPQPMGPPPGPGGPPPGPNGPMMHGGPPHGGPNPIPQPGPPAGHPASGPPPIAPPAQQGPIPRLPPNLQPPIVQNGANPQTAPKIG